MESPPRRTRTTGVRRTGERVRCEGDVAGHARICGCPRRPPTSGLLDDDDDSLPPRASWIAHAIPRIHAPTIRTSTAVTSPGSSRQDLAVTRGRCRSGREPRATRVTRRGQHEPASGPRVRREAASSSSPPRSLRRWQQSMTRSEAELRPAAWMLPMRPAASAGPRRAPPAPAAGGRTVIPLAGPVHRERRAGSTA